MKKVLCTLLVLGIFLTSTFTSTATTIGDVNIDGKINSSDALAILQYTVGSNPFNFYPPLADISKDGRINSADALIVLQIAVGSIQSPIEPNTGNEAKPDENTAMTKADFIKLLNAETAKAAKGSYKLVRGGKFVKYIDVGSATNALNSIIKGIDENASLDSVVGDFLGIKAQPIVATVENGKADVDAKYMIKAMNLTEADVTSYSANGNKYTITIKDCQNPNVNSPMAHATNDYITFPEVNMSIANEVGNAVKIVENESTANYKNIKFVVTVVNGKITAMEYSYTLDATLKLKLAILTATGTGEAVISGKYTDIKYDSVKLPPKSPDEILNYYNNAVNKAVSSKVGFSKTRITDNEKIDGSVVLQPMKDLVYQFMGIGAENAYTATVAKGKWGDVAFLCNSNLTASDITSVTCTQSGDNYVITLRLKNGSSAADKSNPTTPANTSLDKCGICVGTVDKAYYDHKTASVIYNAIAGTFAGAKIKENYSNATVKATINSDTDNLVSLVVEWNQEVTLSKLTGMSAAASGISHVTYKDFKY
jgi:hypothetical protein